VSASEAGIGGTPSTIKFSPGAMVASWVVAAALWAFALEPGMHAMQRHRAQIDIPRRNTCPPGIFFAACDFIVVSERLKSHSRTRRSI
jgi:hypothetical protein